VGLPGVYEECLPGVAQRDLCHEASPVFAGPPSEGGPSRPSVGAVRGVGDMAPAGPAPGRAGAGS
jgi:hypothetical protein